jgi:uncharacterized protein YbjT (DUF2867 family)
MPSRPRSSSDISDCMLDLIVGATGMLGSEIAHQLLKRGRRVRALVRSSARPERIALLRDAGAELVYGDLKAPGTLEAACAGATAVISTASSTNSRAEGDSIETVDGAGQLALIEAARHAAVEQFVFVSFPPSRLDFPLQTAKRAAEASLRASGLGYTVLQPAHFFETWFSEAVGFDLRGRSTRLFGGGDAKLSFVSFRDVARVVAEVLGKRAAFGKTLAFGGPDALSQRDVLSLFEELTCSRFQVENIDAAALTSQAEPPGDALSRSFAALMLLCGASDEYAVGLGALSGLVEMDFVNARTFARGAVAAHAGDSR